MTRQRAFDPAPLPPAIEAPVVGALRAAHEEQPFLPTDVRGAARRVVEVVAAVGLEAQLRRGALDLGGAELDHVFVVVDDRVLDVAMPVNDESFLTAVRAWVAGDEDGHRLDALARRLDLGSRVLGVYPRALRYRGAPLWGATA